VLPAYQNEKPFLDRQRDALLGVLSRLGGVAAQLAEDGGEVRGPARGSTAV
jgi:hypothetical protein